MSETDATADVLTAASRDPSTRSTVLTCNPAISLREVLRRGASRINKLTAQLSAARAEVEQARGNAIEEAAVLCTNEADLRLGRAEKPWAGDEYIQPFSQAMVQASKGFTARDLANRIRAISTATTPKGEG